MTVKRPSAIKALRKFSEAFDVKTKTSVHRLGDSKSERNTIRVGNMMCYNIPERSGHENTNDRVEKALYNWITKYPKVVQSPIINDPLKVSIEGNAGTYFFPKFYCNFLSKKFIIA